MARRTAGMSRWLRKPPEDTPSGVIRQVAAAGAQPRTVFAAAIPLTGDEGRQAWQARAGDQSWQREAWYHYDACGEVRSAVNWIANAVSRAALYAAETDPETGQITGPTEDTRAQAAAAAILGGYEDRPQLQSTMALHWQVPGETFVLIQPRSGQPDRWLVLSDREIDHQGSKWSFTDPLTGVKTAITGRDKLVRIWSPHPLQQTHADSAMRAALPVLREIEKSSQNIAARLDSRLAGNGVLFIPQEIDFPTQEGEAADAASFVRILMDAAEASIQQPGTAAAQVPIVAQVPAEFMAAIADGHLDLSTSFDASVSDLRKDAIVRLGTTLDMPKDVALGTQAEANHWSAWQIEETTYKIHVEPFLLKVASALTREYFRPALRVMGLENADQFVLAWDISEVTARPDQGDDMRDLHDRVLISDDFLRAQFGIPDEAIPDESERQRRWAERLVVISPAVLDNASVAAELGFEATSPGTEQGDVSRETSEPPASVSALPERQTEEPDEGLVAAAELVVFDALSRAGGRLLTRQYRGQFASTLKWELHTVIPQDGRESELMEGSFQFTDNIAHAFGQDPYKLNCAIREYVENRLQWGAVHEREILARYLRRAI